MASNERDRKVCGIVGFFAPGGMPEEAARGTLERMSKALHHRGPDDAGTWVNGAVGVALGHRRLSVVDLSSAGHQPMQSASTRYVIAFNGEIYNHSEVRAVLNTCSWRGHSDTETLLAAIEAWGVQVALTRAIGMFAFALWDRRSGMLTLARDRLGEKPLYYGWQRNGGSSYFLFGSELKALREHHAFSGTVDRDALCLQLRHNYIPAPHSIYCGIRKLPPGHLLQLRRDMAVATMTPTTRPYWSFADAVQRGLSQPFPGDHQDAADELGELLRDAVRRQMVADVPLGAFLSGGVDSSIVVALMQAQASAPVKTFTIGFEEPRYNEAQHAKAVAEHLGTDHTEVYVSPRQALEVIQRLPVIYDEPFADPSQIPTFLLSELARRHVTISLSGDGGDELFGGYGRYFKAYAAASRIRGIPTVLRKGLKQVLRMPVPAALVALMKVTPVLRNSAWGAKLEQRMSLLTTMLNEPNNAALYRQLISDWQCPNAIVIGGMEPGTPIGNSSFLMTNFVEEMMAMDTITYLPDEVLVKVDRAAMAVSLETRMPFLDHRIVEFAWSLPFWMKVHDGQGKWILRQVLKTHMPEGLFDRPKMGFGVPIDSWLRGPLRDWAEDLLAESRIRREGIFHPKPIRDKWAEHLSGRVNCQQQLWDVLMFQAWYECERRCRYWSEGEGTH